MTVDVERLLLENPIAEVVGRYVQLRRDGREFLAHCPFHADRTPSFCVVPAKGFFHCFGCGAHGDAIDFVAAIEGVGFRDAAARLGAADKVVPFRRQTAAPVEGPDLYEAFEPIHPAPEGAFAVGEMTPRIFNPKREGDERREWGQFRPSLVHAYRDAAGALLGYVLRRDFEVEGKRQKETPQVQFVRRGDDAFWARRPFLEPRPLYGLDRLAARPDAPVLLVEGEKAADAAGRLMPSCVAATWPGGGKAYRRVDWSPLAGRDVLLWPDADRPGIETMHAIGDLLLRAGAGRVRMVQVGEGVSCTRSKEPSNGMGSS